MLVPSQDHCGSFQLFGFTLKWLFNIRAFLLYYSFWLLTRVYLFGNFVIILHSQYKGTTIIKFLLIALRVLFRHFKLHWILNNLKMGPKIPKFKYTVRFKININKYVFIEVNQCLLDIIVDQWEKKKHGIRFK